MDLAFEVSGQSPEKRFRGGSQAGVWGHSRQSKSISDFSIYSDFHSKLFSTAVGMCVVSGSYFGALICVSSIYKVDLGL